MECRTLWWIRTCTSFTGERRRGAVQIAKDNLATIRGSAFRHEDSPYGIVVLSAGDGECPQGGHVYLAPPLGNRC
jgi:hypothetical protein